MGLEALRRKMLPELGYPVGWTYAGVWEKNWGTHYGTHITGVSTSSFPISGVSTFAASRPAQYASAASEVASGEEPRPRRQRAIALVDIDERDCYAVTVERVRGGAEHTWSFHGPSGPAYVEGVELAPQGGGTVAGPDVPYRDMQHSPSGDGELRCLNFMPDPKVGDLSGPWQIDHALAGQDNVHLTVTTLTPREGRLSTSVCSAPGGKSPYEATWCIIQRSGEQPFASQFLQVLEPWEGQRRVQDVELLEVEGGAEGEFPPLALRVQADGLTDVIIIQPEGGAEVAAGGITTDAEFALWREAAGVLQSAVLVRGTLLRRASSGLSLRHAEYTGTIESCDWPARTVQVRLEAGGEQRAEVAAPAGQQATAQIGFVGLSESDASALVGRHVRITNRAGNHASHMIVAADPIDGGVELTLDYDARVGEGPVEEIADGQVTSGVSFSLDHFGYYGGKTVANEDGSAAYRFTHLDGRRTCILDAEHHGEVAAATLREQFTDRDGDGLTRMILYDYGPGDTVTIPCWAVLSRQR